MAKFAEDDQRFKDAVCEYVHKRHYKHGISLEKMRDLFVAVPDKGIIALEFKRSMTDADYDELVIHEHFSEYSLDGCIRSYFDGKLALEMEHQVGKFISEADDREREA